MAALKPLTSKDIEKFVKRLNDSGIHHVLLTAEPKEGESGIFSIDGVADKLASMYFGAMTDDDRFAQLLIKICVVYGLTKLEEEVRFEQARRSGNIN